jgi:hypothetical protein
LNKKWKEKYLKTLINQNLELIFENHSNKNIAQTQYFFKVKLPNKYSKNIKLNSIEPML